MTETDHALQPGDEEWRQKWAEMLQHARTRPRMYIGDEATAHSHIFYDALRLIWQAKLFRRPHQVRVDISPHQCAVRCDTGPLIRPVQRMLSFPGGRVLGDDWEDESRAAISRFHAEQETLGVSFDDKKYKRSWRYSFYGPTGPRLGWVAHGMVLAHSLTWGLRTDSGLWCQSFEDGWPAGAPFLVEGPSPVGLFVLADLDPQWWTGLPFDADDVAQLRASSHRPQGLYERWKPEPPWSTGEIVVNWHEQDDLVTERSLTAEGVWEWLSAADPGGKILAGG